MVRLTAALGVLLLLSARASAETRQLSLREAIELAVRRNPALAAAGAELSAAAAAQLAARGLDDPVLAASTRVSGTRREWVPGEPVQDRAVDELSGALSLAQPLSTGGRLQLELQGGHARARYESELADGARRSSTSARYTPGLQLSLEQPLLRGSGVEVARADRKRASIQHDVAGAERETLAAVLLRDVTHGYWGLAHARGELEIRRSSLSAAREQLARVQANIEVGKLPQSATAEIEVAIALRQDSVLAAEQAVIERQLVLGRFCGMSRGEPLSAAEELPAIDALTMPASDPAATLALALGQSPRLSVVRAQLRAGALELRVSEDGLLPQLDLAIAGGPIGNAPSARAAFDQVTGLESYAVMASLALELPLGSHAARGARDAARARLRQARAHGNRPRVADRDRRGPERRCPGHRAAARRPARAVARGRCARSGGGEGSLRRRAQQQLRRPAPAGRARGRAARPALGSFDGARREHVSRRVDGRDPAAQRGRGAPRRRMTAHDRGTPRPAGGQAAPSAFGDCRDSGVARFSLSGAEMDIERAPIHRRGRRAAYALSGVALVIGVSLALREVRPAAPQVERGTLWLDTVRRGPMVREVLGQGKLVPEEIRWVAAKSNARVERILVKPGAVVKRDTLLLELANPELELAALEADRELSQARAELVNLEASLSAEQLGQESIIATLRSELAEATRRARADAELARRGFLSELEQVQTHEHELELQGRLGFEERRLGALSHGRTAQISAQQAQIDRLRSIAEFRRGQVDDLKMRAGVDGVVQELSLEEGQAVASGALLVKVAQPDRLQAEVRIPETRAMDLQVGQRASIDTRNAKVDGHVIRIDPAAAGGNVRVDVKLDGPLPPGARPDLNVEAIIELERLESVLFVGRPAAGQPNTTASLFKLDSDGSGAERVSVQLGRSSVSSVEISSGLREGDRVILSELSEWNDFDRIRIE